MPQAFDLHRVRYTSTTLWNTYAKPQTHVELLVNHILILRKSTETSARQSCGTPIKPQSIKRKIHVKLLKHIAQLWGTSETSACLETLLEDKNQTLPSLQRGELILPSSQVPYSAIQASREIFSQRMCASPLTGDILLTSLHSFAECWHNLCATHPVHSPLSQSERKGCSSSSSRWSLALSC